MCKSKVEGGRRCPSCISRRVSVYSNLIASLTNEIAAAQQALAVAHSSESLNLINEVAVLASRREEAVEKRSEAKAAYFLTDTGFNELQEKAASMTDADDVRQWQQKVEETRKLREADKEKRAKAFKQQEALVYRLSELGVPKDEIHNIRQQVTQDTGTSHLRAASTYAKQLKTARLERKEMVEKCEREKDKVLNDPSLGWEEQDALIEKIEKKWNAAFEKNNAKQRKIKGSYYATVEGRQVLTERAEAQFDNSQAIIQEHMRVGNEAAAVKEQARQAVNWGKAQSMLYRAKVSAEQRLSDRRARFTRDKMIREAVLDAGGTKEDADSALKALREPDPILREKAAATVDSWERSTVVGIYVTSEEQAQLSVVDSDALISRVTQKPALPKGQKLSDIHESFKRHTNGMGHRQTTVQGLKRSERVKVSLTRRELNEIGARASSLGVSLSSYLRGMCLEGNPFHLLNDRSKNTRKLMRKRAREMLSV